MDTQPKGRPASSDHAVLLARLGALVPAMQRRAVPLDRDGGFPADDIDALRGIGVLAAPVSAALGGLGWGTEPEAALPLLAALRLIGRGNLAVGRLYEGHVNALKLIVRFGTPVQARRAANDAASGHLFGVWNTEAPDAPLRLGANGALRNGKLFCSGAGHVTRALVTASRDGEAPRMLIVELEKGTRAEPPESKTQGMRAAATGRMDLDGLPVTPDALLGEPGDYLHQPEFSGGAWRTSAVTLGGLDALVETAKAQLVARGRDGDPHHRARIGQALIAQESAALWMRRAAVVAESGSGGAAEVVAYTNLARLAVEAACLDAMRLVQRSVGLAAFVPPNPLDRICRDLGMYLRQPAPDIALDEAAAHFITHPLPEPSWP